MMSQDNGIHPTNNPLPSQVVNMRYHIEYCYDEIGEEWSIWPNTDFPLQEEPYQPYSEDTESNMIMLCFEANSLVEAVEIAERRVNELLEKGCNNA